MRSNTVAVLVALIAAAVLRLLRVGVRWDELSLAYAAYAEPLTRSVADVHPTALLGSWIGLHPPLFGVLHAVTEVVAPVPLLWLLGSALISWATVWIVARHSGGAAALVLATAPIHLLDAAEVNNYPLASLSMALVLLCASRAWYWLALSVMVAGWTHLLAGVAAVAVVVWRIWWGPRVHAQRLSWAVVLGLLPIGGGAFRLMGLGSTWNQPAIDGVAWVEMAVNAVGFEGLLLAPLVLWGLRGSARVQWMALAGTLVFAILLGAAASHQRPYLGLLAPAAAVAVGTAVRQRPRLMWVVGVLCLVRGGLFLADDWSRMQHIRADLDRDRAIDQVIEASAPGDTLWLVSPALQADDDKTATGEVMWRLPPWERMAIARPVDFEYKDYRYGQPRTWRERTVHTSTELDPVAFDHVAGAALRGEHRVWVVLYDHAPATGLQARVERVLQPYRVQSSPIGDDVGLGRDWLYQVEAIQ